MANNLLTAPCVLPALAPVTYPNTGASTTGAVTPSDTTTFPWPTRLLYVGVTGTLVVKMRGVTVTFGHIPVGFHPIACEQVLAATTAAEIVALN